jgi:ribosome-binding factor A
MVSVTAVKVSQDMHHALVSVSVLPAEYQQLTLHGLNSAAKHIHGKLFKQLRVRRLPFLKFQIDESIKKQAEVFAAIQEGLAKENPNRSEASELPESLVTPESPETSAPSSANSPEDTQESTS